MRRPFVFPLLIAGAPVSCSVESDCRDAIRAAWREGKPKHKAASIKAARDRLACGYRTPADLNAIVRTLAAYDAKPWPTEQEMDQPIDWLWLGLPCDSPRRGTCWDARIAARFAIAGAVSILLDVPIEHAADEAAIIETLSIARWRVPAHQQKTVARRVERYVTNEMARRPFVPVNWRAAA